MCWALAIVIGLLIFIWADIERSKAKQAMWWWFERHLVALEQQSDQIHNGPMQDLFVVRRSMELANANFQESNRIEQGAIAGESLHSIEKAYAALEQLSHSLCPAYISESLPLAIQSRVTQWDRSHPQVVFKLDMPNTWQQTSSYQDHLVVHVLEELIKITFLLPCSIKTLQIELHACSTCRNLNIQLSYAAAESLKAVLISKELDYLRHSFGLLSSGKCSYWTKGQDLFVRLQWNM